MEKAIRIALRSMNKLSIVDGSYPKPESDSPLAEMHCYPSEWIMNVVATDLFLGMVYYISAKQVWTIFRERFEKLACSRIFALLKESQ